MSWFAPDVNTINRATGRSAVAAAAYRSGERLTDERTGELHDYTRKGGVEARFIVAPEDAPAWATDRERLWNEAERAEKRQASRLARELMLPLPAEVDDAARRRIAEDTARFLVERYGVAVDAAIHRPHRQGDRRNHHAHLLFTTRELGPDGLGAKTRILDSAKTSGPEVEAIRAHAARAINRELERAGRERIDHRSYERQGIDREAEQHMGHAASAMERKGKATELGSFNRAVAARNAEREALRAEAGVIDLALEREKREALKSPPDIARNDEERRAREREESRFEAWANRRRAELQSRQLDDKGDLGRRHDQQRMNLNDRLADTYRPGIEEANRTLTEIEARERTGRVARFVYRLSGQASRDREEAEAARATLADIQGRMAEQQGKLERAQEAEQVAQEASHRWQARTLEQRITDAYGRREREGWQPLPDREPANDREKEQPEETKETGWERVQRLRAELAERERQQGRNGRDFERER